MKSDNVIQNFSGVLLTCIPFKYNCTILEK